MGKSMYVAIHKWMVWISQAMVRTWPPISMKLCLSPGLFQVKTNQCYRSLSKLLEIVSNIKKLYDINLEHLIRTEKHSDLGEINSRDPRF